MNRKTPDAPRDSEGGIKSQFKGVQVLRLLVVVLLTMNLILLYAIFFSSQGISGYRRHDEQVKELEAKSLKLKKENQRLFDKIVSFKNDPQAQERLVRQELGWVRDNEIMIEFGPPNTAGPRKK